MKNIVMLCTIHELQMSTNDRSSELVKCLEYLITEFKAQESVDVQTVMEEYHKSLRQTVGKDFAMKSGLHWANIGTPEEEQFLTYRYPISFVGYNGILRSDGNAPQMREYGPFENQEARERQMVQNVVAEMENYENGILILGNNHMHSMFGKLRDAGFDVYGFSYL